VSIGMTSCKDLKKTSTDVRGKMGMGQEIKPIDIGEKKKRRGKERKKYKILKVRD